MDLGVLRTLDVDDAGSEMSINRPQNSSTCISQLFHIANCDSELINYAALRSEEALGYDVCAAITQSMAFEFGE